METESPRGFARKEPALVLLSTCASPNETPFLSENARGELLWIGSRSPNLFSRERSIAIDIYRMRDVTDVLDVRDHAHFSGRL